MSDEEEPAFLPTLVDELEGVWQTWAWRSCPPEQENLDTRKAARPIDDAGRRRPKPLPRAYDENRPRTRIRGTAGGARRLGPTERRHQGRDGSPPLRAGDARRRAPTALELLLPRPRHRPAGAVRRTGAGDRARLPERRPRRDRRRRDDPGRARRRRRDVDRRRRAPVVARPRPLRDGDHGRRARSRGACFFSKTLDGVGALPDASYRSLDQELLDVLVVGRPIAAAEDDGP